ncbi:helix-turn-helix domain-containing protein [Galbibacter sp. BG1]
MVKNIVQIENVSKQEFIDAIKEATKDSIKALYESVKSKDGDAKEFYSVSDISNILRQKSHTVRRLLRNGELKGHKTGKAWKISREQLQEFLESNKNY